MERAGAVLTSVETALFELLGRAGTDEFKASPEADPRIRAESGPAQGEGEDHMSGYVLLEDGTRLDGELLGSGEALTGEVVFNTAMTGYQEAVTRPQLRRPDHHLHLPADRQLRRLGRGDGVRPRPRARR